jgi:hypothetical protein
LDEKVTQVENETHIDGVEMLVLPSPSISTQIAEEEVTGENLLDEKVKLKLKTKHTLMVGKCWYYPALESPPKLKQKVEKSRSNNPNFKSKSS